jgi:hypothetical protein
MFEDLRMGDSSTSSSSGPNVYELALRQGPGW